jgi:hypothetical protein
MRVNAALCKEFAPAGPLWTRPRRNTPETAGAIAPKQARLKPRANFTGAFRMTTIVELAFSAAVALGGFGLAFLINPYLPI